MFKYGNTTKSELSLLFLGDQCFEDRVWLWGDWGAGPAGLPHPDGSPDAENGVIGRDQASQTERGEH